MSPINYDPIKVALLCQGTFDGVLISTPPDPPVIVAPNTAPQSPPPNGPVQTACIAAADIGQAGFGTVLLGQWHVSLDGIVSYNASPYPYQTTPQTGDLDFEWTLGVVPRLLKAAGIVQKVLLSFGGWACNDFTHMGQNLPLFLETMQEIFDKYPLLDGLDFDPEDGITYKPNGAGAYVDGDDFQFNDYNAQTLATVAIWAAAQGKIVTGTPYLDSPLNWWNQVLGLTKSASNGPTSFSWLNLQNPGGPIPYGQWVTDMENQVTNPQPFITYGFNFDKTSSQDPSGNLLSPNDVTTRLQALVKEYTQVEGAFIWRYEDITNPEVNPERYTAAAYAQALIDGLA